MRILHVADFHGHVPYFEFLSRMAKSGEYGIMAVAGDLIDLRHDGSVPEQIAAVKAALAKITTPVAVCSGNHDTIHAESSRMGDYWVSDLRRPNRWVDEDRFELKGQRFYVHRWLDPIPTAAPGEVWLIHGPPEGTATSLGVKGGEFGDHEFARLCLAGMGPKFALCGHVHHPQAWLGRLGQTLVLVPGVSGHPEVPAYIEIDLARRTATRHMPGANPETIRLPGATAREVIRGRSPSGIEALLDLTIANQRAEGIEMSPEEIETVRRRLMQLGFGDG